MSAALFAVSSASVGDRDYAVGILFISHSSLDNDQAIKVRDWLKGHGWRDVFLDLDPQNGLAPGHRWQDELKKAGERCSGVLMLISPNWVASRWCQTEFLLADQLGKRIFPLFVVPTQFEELPIELKAKFQIADVSAPDKEADGFERLAIGLKRAGLNPQSFEWPPARDPNRSVYRGLLALEEEDAAIFFGRDAQITEALDAMRRMRDGAAKRMLVIQGASGAGKSSFLKAGIMARLKRDEENFVALPVIRPERAALSGGNGLAASLGCSVDRLQRPEDLVSLFGEIRAPVIARLKRFAESARETYLAKEPTLVVPIDQAEELFNSENTEAPRFLELLADALLKDDNAIAVVTIRTDAFAKMQEEPRLSTLPRLPFDLPALPPSGFKEVIEGPARLSRPPITIEPALVEQLLKDLAAEDALPLLAFALQRLWRLYSATGALLREHYQAIGKLHGIIEDAAERAMLLLSPASEAASLGRVSQERDEAVARLFIPSLAQLNDRGGVVRRICPLSSFNPEQRAQLDHFAQWRLIVTSENSVEVAHEAIFREWSRFGEWVVRERNRLDTLRSLEAAALNWAQKSRTRVDLVHRGKRLAEAKALRRLDDYRALISANPDCSAYLDACQKLQNRNRLVTAGAAASIALVAAFVISIPAILRQMAHAEALRRHSEAVSKAQHYVATSRVLSDGAEAAGLRPGTVFRDCPNCPEMVVLPAGQFSMGSPDNQAMHSPDESPVHPVNITSIAMGRFDVTFDDWDTCIRAGRCHDVKLPVDYAGGRGRWPVIAMSSTEAIGYAAWLSEITRQTYRLPSEAEWEYAARAGTKSPFYTGSTITHEQANFGNVNPGIEPVGSYPRNGFGLYDMAGNASQWVADCFNPSYVGAPTDGSARTTGACARRIIRGGNYYMDISAVRSPSRSDAIADWPAPHLGFRVVRELNSQHPSDR